MKEVPQDLYVYVQYIDLYTTAHFILSIRLSFLFLALTLYKSLKTFIKPDFLVCQCILTVVFYIDAREATVLFSATVYKFPAW